MSSNIETIADGIRKAAIESPEAFTAHLDGLWAPTVIAEHEPPQPKLDGPRPGAQQTETHLKEDKEFRRMMSDYRLDRVATKIDGPKVSVSTHISGTLSGDRRIALPVTWVFTFTDGQITHALTAVDWAVAKPFVEMLNAARIIPD